MGWQDLLAPVEGTERVLPWTGGRKVTDGTRTWGIQGRTPDEHGWYEFNTSGGRKATLIGPAEADFDLDQTLPTVRGYLVGDRLIPDAARVVPDPAMLLEQTVPIFCVELGLGRFTRALAVRVGENLVYLRPEFPLGPEFEVIEAYQDREDSVDNIKEVTPALDLAFRWISYQRVLAEERAAELARLLEEERLQRERDDRMAEAVKSIGTGAGRRALAQIDFNAAATAALAISGAELLDVTQGRTRREMIVQYRFRHRRLECVVNRDTLRIIDSGVCLGHGGAQGDRFFTLESLPAVIAEALDRGILHVYRNVDGDPGHHERRWNNDGWDEDGWDE